MYSSTEFGEVFCFSNNQRVSVGPLIFSMCNYLNVSIAIYVIGYSFGVSSWLFWCARRSWFQTYERLDMSLSPSSHWAAVAQIVLLEGAHYGRNILVSPRMPCTPCGSQEEKGLARYAGHQEVETGLHAMRSEDYEKRICTLCDVRIHLRRCIGIVRWWRRPPCHARWALAFFLERTRGSSCALTVLWKSWLFGSNFFAVDDFAKLFRGQ